MKTVFTIYIIVLNLVSNQFSSQVNLVNNPSFEDLTNSGLCPDALDQVNRCAGWNAIYATPDYFNACGTLVTGVPKNITSYQAAASGQAYAGFISLFFVPAGQAYTVREYLGTHLTQTLVPGTRYYLSMKVSMAEHWDNVSDGEGWNWKTNTNTATFTLLPTYLPSNKFGMKFYTKAHNLMNMPNPYSLMNNSAHLYSQNIVSDTTNWTTIQGSFVADSAYTHIMIGNFFVNTDTIARNYSYQSYYFVDDIIVSTDGNILTGLNENSTKNNIAKLYPNPVADKLSLEFLIADTDDLKFVITNTLGQMVLNSRIKIQNHKAEIDLTFLQSGIYYLKIEGGKEAGTFKIIKQ